MWIASDNEIHPRLKLTNEQKQKMLPEIGINDDEYENEKYKFLSSNKIYEIIDREPHIKLNAPEFDIETALNEITIIDNFSMFNPDASFETQSNKLHDSWGARSLINYCPDSRQFFQKLAKESSVYSYPELQNKAITDKKDRYTLNDMEFYKTELWDKMPYITKYITDNISDHFYRVWILLIKKNGYVNWHNHTQLAWHKNKFVYDKAVVHIPLITNDKTKMLVMKDNKIYAEHYKRGECWLFNSGYPHAADNMGTEDRIHIMAFCKLDDNKFMNLLKNSLKV